MQDRRFRLLLLLLCCFLPLAAPVAGQEPGSLHRYLEREPLRLPDFSLRPYETLFVTRPFLHWVEEWTASTRALLEREQQGRLTLARRQRPVSAEGVEVITVAEPELQAVSDTVAFLPPLAARRARAGNNPLGGLVGEAADLGIRVTGNGSLGGAWTRYKPCDPSVYFNCNPGLFPQLKPDVEFGIRVGGTISDRVHVDVDYDQAREFDAANNINVFYQGLIDEPLQRVEVGDVSIRLPTSRYLTRGIPAGNFGFMASGQLGPLDFQTVFAQQKGDLTTREFRLGGGNNQGLVQDATLVLDDAEYVRGQFFFLLPPSALLGQPHVDVLALRPTDAPAAERPEFGGTIEVYRDERPGAQGGQTAQVGYFLADAVPPGGGPRHTGSFRRLLQEQDYIVHASGLWIMLRSPLRADEALAVSFITESGDTVGRMNAEAAPPGTTPRLRLLRGPTATHQPGAPTWDLEMHQVYRLDSSSDVDLSTIDLTISLGEQTGGRTFRDVAGQQLSFLKFFGLDEDAPADRLDAGQVYQPARESIGTTGAPIGGTFIVLPTLRPFAVPAPVASARISAEDLRAALGRDANDVIYDDPDPVNRVGAARFRLNFQYRVKVEGLVSSFNLGAFGIRESSERLTLGSRTLVRDIDYTIDYEIGVVTLMDPQNLFATNPSAEIRATWEQKPLFNIAPTSVFGASARYRVGARGELNFVGLYQAEKSLMTRPQLGVEPGSTFLGGVSGRFNIGGGLLDRMLSSVPRLRSDRASAISLNGEVAFSMPNPNREGAAYLDDFEASEEIGLSVRRQDWKLGAAPQSTEGDRGRLPFIIDAASAVPLVWQHDFVNQSGQIGGALQPRSQIDRQINIIGNDLPEPVMWLTFGRGTGGPSPLPPPPDARRWRSITTLLSTTGRDMSRSEYLELYVGAGRQDPISLVIDIGTVSEDAFYIDSLGNTTGSYPDGKRWGLGLLDEEAVLTNREVWGRDKDELGLWNQQCRGEPLATYALGDRNVNCTRNNGLQDTEDLNGNGVLDGDDGQYFRYVIELDRLSEYLVRDTLATGTVFRLYRIPLRSGVAVNGANDGTWRFIRHLRMTIAGEPQAERLISIARMRIVGSRWTKRDVSGIQRGRLDAEEGAGAALGEVRVGPVSRLTDGSRYSPPPGVADQLQDPTQQFGGGGFEINEKSLRLEYTSLQPDERAETYFRYPQQPRDLRMYSQFRLWVLPRAGNWGETGDQELLIKVGTDARNYYLYRTKLRPAKAGNAQPADWLPEVIIDFNRWYELRAEAERLLIERGPRPAGQDTVWSADSTYAIVIEDRGRAPNLAAVRELTFAVYNAGAFPADGEVWIDELRVLGPDRDPGAAGNVSLDIAAGDLFNATFSVANQGALFRQLNESPSYVGGADIAVNADAHLDRLLPASWGIDLPLSITHSRNAQNPTFLQQSDVLADRLDGLRSSDADATRIGVRLSKRTPTANPLLSLLIDGAALRVSYNTAANQSITYRSENSGFAGDLSYRRDIAPRTLGVFPGFITDVLRALTPDGVEQSDAFERLLGSQLRWSPASLSFGSAYADQMTRAFRYDRILALPTDTGVVAIESPRQVLRNDAQLALQPFRALNASIGIASDRDVLAAERASTQTHERAAMAAARSAIGGVDIGWETARAINTAFGYRPEITRWLSAGYTYNNRYLTDRNPSYLELDVTGTDTLPILQRRFESSRQTARTLRLEPQRMVGALVDSASTLGALLGRLELINLQWTRTLSSQFERERFLPGIGYQLGLGSFDSFREMNADTAARAQLRDGFRATGGVGLPLGARIDVNYHNSDIESFDRRGGTRTQNEVGWPSVTLQFRELRLPASVQGVISNAQALIGVERVERTAVLGGSTNQTRGTTEIRVPASLQLSLRRGFSVLYRASYSMGETLDPTGNAENAGNQHDLTLSGFFNPPERWRQKLNGPISVQLNYSEQQQRQCRFTPALAELEGCISFLDVGSRNGRLQIESKISDLDVGVQLNYVARQNHVGTRSGSSQFNLSLYGRFNFTAGQMPARFR